MKAGAKRSDEIKMRRGDLTMSELRTRMLVGHVHERYLSRGTPPSYDELADRLAVSRTTVIAHVKHAERLGLLEREIGVKRSLRLTRAGLDELGATGLRDDDGEVSWAKPEDAARWQLAVGQRLRQARTSAGLTQLDLARKSDISAAYISQVELGQRNIALVNLLALAQALNVRPGSLLDNIL